MFNKYYEDELVFLRELGAEFARANPAAAPFLAERGADPDVERLLEGFAFLAGRLRQKLDDELPELTQSLMQMIWPHYLRPVPALSILQFEPLPQAVKESLVIPAGTEVASVPVDGTACRFRTTAPVILAPWALESASLERPAGTAGAVRVVLNPAPGSKGFPDRLRLFLHGEPAASSNLFLHLTRRLKQIVIHPAGMAAGGRVTLPASALVPGGLDEGEALWPYPAASPRGYRLLQEYFALPEKFLFLDLVGMPSPAALGIAGPIEILLELDQAPDALLRVGPESLRLHCTPVVNLFSGESDPLSIEHEKVEYRLRVAGGDPGHLEIFSIDAVRGWVRGSADPREFPAFHSFRHEGGFAGSGTVYYQARLKESVVDRRIDVYLSFVGGRGELAELPAETVCGELTCTNRALPGKLKIGDISKATDNSPTLARFRNITPVKPGIMPPLGSGLHWRLISNMALNYLSLASLEALRGVLTVYNFHALVDRQAAREHELRLAGLAAVRRSTEERLYQGAPIRGTRVEIDMIEDNFAGEGEMVLFAGVLNEFLSLFATVNSFCRLVVKGLRHGEVYEWSPRLGSQPLI